MEQRSFIIFLLIRVGLYAILYLKIELCEADGGCYGKCF